MLISQTLAAITPRLPSSHFPVASKRQNPILSGSYADALFGAVFWRTSCIIITQVDADFAVATTGDGILVKVKFCTALVRLALFIAFAILIRASVFAASVNPHPLSSHSSHSKSRHVTESQHARRRMHALAHSRAPLTKSASASYRRHHYYERFYTSSFVKSD